MAGVKAERCRPCPPVGTDSEGCVGWVGHASHPSASCFSTVELVGHLYDNMTGIINAYTRGINKVIMFVKTVQAHVVLKSAQLLEADEDEEAAAGTAGAGGGAGITVSVVTGCMAVGVGVVVEGVGVTRVLSLETKALALRLTGTSDSGIFSA